MAARETVKIDKKALLHAIAALEAAHPDDPAEVTAHRAFYVLGVLKTAEAFAGLDSRAEADTSE